MNYYWSDPHIGHRNVIKYSQRAFSSLDEMDRDLILNWMEVLGEGHTVYSLGDISFNLRRRIEQIGEKLESGYEGLLKWFEECGERSVLITGNHDGVKSSSKKVYHRMFGKIIGDERTWTANTLIVEDSFVAAEGEAAQDIKLLLSHAPQRDLQGANFNIFGHVHNNLQNKTERNNYEWLDFDNPHTPYYNVSVEMIGYRPRTFQQLYRMRHEYGLSVL